MTEAEPPEALSVLFPEAETPNDPVVPPLLEDEELEPLLPPELELFPPPELPPRPPPPPPLRGKMEASRLELKLCESGRIMAWIRAILGGFKQPD
jgi:hypothetical protein